MRATRKIYFERRHMQIQRTSIDTVLFTMKKIMRTSDTMSCSQLNT